MAGLRTAALRALTPFMLGLGACASDQSSPPDRSPSALNTERTASRFAAPFSPLHGLFPATRPSALFSVNPIPVDVFFDAATPDSAKGSLLRVVDSIANELDSLQHYLVRDTTTLTSNALPRSFDALDSVLKHVIEPPVTGLRVIFINGRITSEPRPYRISVCAGRGVAFRDSLIGDRPMAVRSVFNGAYFWNRRLWVAADSSRSLREIAGTFQHEVGHIYANHASGPGAMQTGRDTGLVRYAPASLEHRAQYIERPIGPRNREAPPPNPCAPDDLARRLLARGNMVYFDGAVRAADSLYEQGLRVASNDALQDELRDSRAWIQRAFPDSVTLHGFINDFTILRDMSVRRTGRTSHPR